MELNQYNQPFHGIPNGIYYGQQERTDELNKRYAERQFSDQPVKPQYGIRSVQTKYSVFPIVDRRTPINEPLNIYLAHSSETNFCPNMSRGPFDGFSENVETESTLRNQRFALQRGADQGIYVPSSTSDLYNVSAVGRQETQPHHWINPQYSFSQDPHPNIVQAPQIGKDRFSNNTRTQLRCMEG